MPTNFLRSMKIAPVLLLALLAVGTGLQVACSDTEQDTGSSEDDLCGYGYNGYGKYGYGSARCPYGYGNR